MWNSHDTRRWFGAAAHLTDDEIWQAELKAARRDAAAARAEEEATRRPSWRHVVRRMLRRKR
jgi:hypothetical protein